LVAPELAWLVAEVDHAFAGIWMQVIQSVPASSPDNIGHCIAFMQQGSPWEADSYSVAQNMFRTFL
jgi:hypothetical protein